MNQKSKSGKVLHGILALFLLTCSTTVFFIPILVMGLLKLMPILSLKVACTKIVDKLVSSWCQFNSAYINLTQNINWQISGLENIVLNDWYLLIANHQSWLDIVVLQYLFTKKIPMFKFFIKDQLKWVPLLGFSWWAMGCPFMKRYSKEYLVKYPHKKGKDMEVTRKAITLLQHSPATIMNFIEGTRFTASKKAMQQSPYQHLLKPKAGGLSFVISAMGKKIDSLLDVTIVYANEEHSLWDFLCHKVEGIKVHIRQIPIPPAFSNEKLFNDLQTQNEFRQWLNQQWDEKDALINRLKLGSSA